MTIDELLNWKKANQQALTAFLHQHREISGIHFMPGDVPSDAHIEVTLKAETELAAFETELRAALGSVPHRVVVLNEDDDPSRP